ncbi:S-adenosyl-L-methionine-dependent methyltransferase [Myriangium duriaei CBS 260.36]|uniref:S-adenosyl-L-methionine-dependent methyltransferase n=1 Tax=Myriangium duriaei CBS 260.36 TaxID=1168546 RepID=A0A9P4JAR5_9PEZI|nr:S-adenosyl-L-methionine-dependent methyltransferase [Myriangium duriaei CBS 260.36]
MPRLRPAVVCSLRQTSPLLKSLLIATRDLPSAKNELRWLTEHAQRRATTRFGDASQPRSWRQLLISYCQWRGRHVPLQYILGTEFFGDLEIKCRPGVLIPRQETASITTHLAHLISTSGYFRSLPTIRILDLCTGTGCIPLLLHHLLRSSGLEAHITGVDISPVAIGLAKQNLTANPVLGDGSTMEFVQADVLASPSNPGSTGIQSLEQALSRDAQFDVLVSNPPYISPRHFRRTTASSVRRFEPRSALVPSPESSVAVPGGQKADDVQADAFYPALLAHAARLGVEAVLFEVGDGEQAGRVAGMAETLRKEWGEGMMEIWRDEPGLPGGARDFLGGVRVMGRGNIRGVFVSRRGSASKE